MLSWKYNNNNVGSSNALVGSLTANATLGLSYWFTDNIGLTYSSTYKHSFKDYLTKHFQHALGLSINFGGEVEEPEVVEESIETINTSLLETVETTLEVADLKPDSNIQSSKSHYSTSVFFLNWDTS